MTVGKNSNALGGSAMDPTAFVCVYEDHAESMLVWFARRVYDTDLALDLTAETFAQAYLARRRFRGTTDAEAAGWLYGIARRQLAMFFRRRKAEQKALRRLGIEPPRLDEEQHERLEELAGLSDLRAAVRHELDRLSDAQREALRLRVVDELPYLEVARRLRISEVAARARVARGLKALAESLDRNPHVKEMLP